MSSFLVIILCILIIVYLYIYIYRLMNEHSERTSHLILAVRSLNIEEESLLNDIRDINARNKMSISDLRLVIKLLDNVMRKELGGELFEQAHYLQVQFMSRLSYELNKTGGDKWNY